MSHGGGEAPLTTPKHARPTRSSRYEREGISFYEGSPRVKPPGAGFWFTVFVSFLFLQAVFALVGPVQLRVRARCARHHLLSVSGFLPSTRCCMRPKRARRTGFRTRRPIYQDGRVHGTAQEIHGRLDQPATLQAPLVDWLECSDLGGDEPRALGHHAVLEVTPQRDQ